MSFLKELEVISELRFEVIVFDGQLALNKWDKTYLVILRLSIDDTYGIL